MCCLLLGVAAVRVGMQGACGGTTQSMQGSARADGPVLPAVLRPEEGHGSTFEVTMALQTEALLHASAQQLPPAHLPGGRHVQHHKQVGCRHQPRRLFDVEQHICEGMESSCEAWVACKLRRKQGATMPPSS